MFVLVSYLIEWTCSGFQRSEQGEGSTAFRNALLFTRSFISSHFCETCSLLAYYVISSLSDSFVSSSSHSYHRSHNSQLLSLVCFLSPITRLSYPPYLLTAVPVPCSQAGSLPSDEDNDTQTHTATSVNALIMENGYEQTEAQREPIDKEADMTTELVEENRTENNTVDQGSFS